MKNRGADMRARKERGFTLIEMLVALFIAGIFFSILAGIILATFQTLQSGDERTVAQQNARVSLNYIANDIRHAKEIAPLRFEAYRDWATGGLPYDADTYDPFFSGLVSAWPVYRRSVDGAPADGNQDGIIDLDIDGGTGDQDEYSEFRVDGRPYDVRALAPNRIELLFFGSTYYPNTEYWSGVGANWDIDYNGSSFNNPTSAMTRVMYEHQLVTPLGPDLYSDASGFRGINKQFDMVVNRSQADSIQDSDDFVIVRSFEVDNPTISGPDNGATAHRSDGDLGTISAQFREDEQVFRQPVADHVVNLRFRYWHITGDRMLEIRYDPDTRNISTSGIDTDDGYYRYFDIYGNEIYVYYNWFTDEMVPLLPADPDQDDYNNVPVNSFFIDGSDTTEPEFQRGVLLFEGWRFVNAVSITIKTANNRTLNIYRSTINLGLTDPYTQYDYGMGLIDFGFDAAADIGTGTLNEYQPLYQGVDNVRASSSQVAGHPVFDFVEPNMNPNYDPNAFMTLQTFVAPPSLKERADHEISSRLTYGLGHKWELGG
jgi:prepilin-type N-terminal cleavage/methylation domain-containing protein